MTRRTIFLDKCTENMGPNCSVCYVCMYTSKCIIFTICIAGNFLPTWCWGVLWAERLGRQVSEAGGQMCRQKVRSAHYEFLRISYSTQNLSRFGIAHIQENVMHCALSRWAGWLTWQWMPGGLFMSSWANSM